MRGGFGKKGNRARTKVRMENYNYSGSYDNE